MTNCSMNHENFMMLLEHHPEVQSTDGATDRSSSAALDVARCAQCPEQESTTQRKL